MDYKKLMDMTGKVCIVVGGTGYLCSENAKILKDFGATVVVADIHEREDRWEKKAEDLGYDKYVYCNVTDIDSLANCFKEVYETYGRIDVLVNGALYGAAHGEKSWLEKMDDETFCNCLVGTAAPVFRGIHEVVPYMKKNGGGSIINYCSMYGLVTPDLRVYGDSHQRQPITYGAGKAAVDQMTRYAACDLAKYNIRVNSVTPGPFPNPRNQNDVNLIPKLADKTILGRIGQSFEMAGAVLLLASDASSFMTGTNIVVDGGWIAW